MSHEFSFTHTVQGVSADAFTRMLATEGFHLGLARQLNGEGLEVLALEVSKTRAVFKRRHPLNAKLPGPLQKVVKDSLTLTRTDTWDIERLVCNCNFELNAPIRMSMKLTVEPGVQEFRMRHDWVVSVSIPLVGKVLAGVLEQDIRGQAQGELAAFDQHCRAQLGQ